MIKEKFSQQYIYIYRWSRLKKTTLFTDESGLMGGFISKVVSCRGGFIRQGVVL